MIRPRFISAGDRIAVTAPSAGVSDPTDVRRFENAVSVLRGRGYDVTLTPNVYSDIGDGRSSSAEQRAKEADSVLGDPGIAYVISAKGGDHLNEMFDHTDLSCISDAPKWVQGYSDNTDILFRITTVYDIMSVYCGNFGDYGMEPWHRSISENLEFLEGKRTEQDSFDTYESGFKDRITGLEPIEGDVPVRWTSDGNVSFSGIAIGGCTDKLRDMAGTGWDRVRDFAERYRDDGIVWYMETYASDATSFADDLRKMRDNGWFEHAKGFVFGRPLFFEGDYVDTVRGVLEDLDLPIVFDADIGHKAPRMTIINGARMVVDVRDGRGRISYPGLTEDY
ncbi:MAG: LD-carboxypeptidase [Candidatus Methanomethylophilaceae archaeon]|nr:LD-carboxypeptidase [Candidatus Methanomethylophilaceae archaeon]MDY5872157.1 LD-carboxypeptidase [Candidatus Methanomethylophilaceae archaeon]